jgi:ABC transporter substrate binding protein (PQQ-dependent alcohol dehydrogenase system)
LGEDPRQRGENNVRLLTSQANYDVVFLADTVGEFGRYVPYQTLLPRPVVGSEGLVADAWDWTFERQGAPQLNRRFDKIAGRRMSAFDWAAWAGVKAVVEAISRVKSTDIEKLQAYLTSEALNLDTYKGAPNSFRPWDHQLRQPILLHTANAVIARAPIDGFLHKTNNLDTLGVDTPETKCRM